ncbi:MAG: phosphatidate cytidylyltransferase [Oscillospiraceae bacterium]|nr:phosphatidate cytidylyltransferase [Oscillospiraceae bacterium]
MKTRIMSSAIGVPVIILILILSQLVTEFIATIILSLLSVLMVSEVLSARKLLKNFKISAICIAYGFAMPMVSFTRFWFLPFFLYIVATLCVMVFFHENVRLMDIAYSFFTTILVTTGVASITAMTTAYYHYCAFFAVLTMAIPWGADAGAYFVGLKYGKNKLCPNISPKKTVEGALGGIASGVVVAMIIGLVFNFIFGYDYVNYIALIVIGLVNTPLSILGDLSFSVIKRNLGIKDYGDIIPGHGGMLDRFDSIIVTAPFVYVVTLFTVVIL